MTIRKPPRQATDRLGDRLVAEGIITDDQLRLAVAKQLQTKSSLAETILGMGYLTTAEIKPHLEVVTGFPFIDIMEENIDRELATAIPKTTIVAHRALPFRETNGRVLVAMVDPLDIAAIDEFRAALGRPIEPCLALANDLNEAIRRACDSRDKMKSLLSEIGSATLTTVEDTQDEVEEMDEAPIVRLVNSIVIGAITAGASDIHVEPQDGSVRVRYRVDGVMYEQMTIPSSYLPACVSRLKILSGLDIAERRRPQDGRFSTRDDGGRQFDIRLSLMPTVYGEKACMRLLEKANSLASVEKLGFFPEQRTLFERIIRRPHGLILVTGPTGSGKSTTLYAALQAINDESKNINTIEDPVEYRLSGINQVQVNHKIGVTFAAGLRTLVRQDPDVILVGEIRDKDTAEIAIQAALTGHLVLSTLHTNDAPGALIRLQNMGIEPFLITSAIIGVLGQRLLRNICPYCKEEYTPSMDQALAAGIPIINGVVPRVSRGIGCTRCEGRGSKGRSAAIEMMSMTETLREKVLSGCSGPVLSEQARLDGMITMHEGAARKALAHQVSLDEILRVFAQED